MIESIITYVVAPIATIFFTWLVARKKNTAEASHSELENVEQAIKIWRELATSFQEKLQEKDSSITELKAQMESIIEQNKQLIDQNQKLLTNIGKLHNDNLKLQKVIDEIKKEN